MAQKKKAETRKKWLNWKQPATRIGALLLTILLMIGAILLVVYRDKVNLDALKRYITYRNLEKNDAGQTTEFSYTRDASNVFASLDGTLLLCSDTVLQLYSNSGLLYIDEQVKMDQPVIATCGSYAVAYDVGGNDLYVIHGKEVVQTYSSAQGCDLLSVRVNENGYLAVVEQASGYKASVKVFDADKQLLLTENVSSEYVMDAVLSPDNKRLAVVTIGQKDKVFNSTVNLYECAEGDLIASATLENQFVLDLNWKNNLLWVQERDGAAVLDSDLKVIGNWTESNQYLQGYSLDGDGYAVEVFSWYKTGGSGEVLLINENGEAEVSQAISGEVLSVSAAGKYIAVLTTDTLHIYTSDLKEYSTTENSGSKRAIIDSDGATMMIGVDSTRLYVP